MLLALHVIINVCDVLINSNVNRENVIFKFDCTTQNYNTYEQLIIELHLQTKIIIMYSQQLHRISADLTS